MLEFSFCALIVPYLILVIFHYIFTFFYMYSVFQLSGTLAERRDGPNPPLSLFLYSDSSLVQLERSLGYSRQFLEPNWNLAIRLQIQTPCTAIKAFLSLHACSEDNNVPWASSEVVHFCFALKNFRWMEWYCPEKLLFHGIIGRREALYRLQNWWKFPTCPWDKIISILHGI